MKEEKQFLLDEIKEKIDSSKAIVVTSYSGFKANSNAKFRDLIAETGGDFEVVRKRVFLKAAQEAGIEFTREELEGHLAVVFAKEDPIQTTKALFKFSKDNAGVFEVRAGHFEGKKIGPADVKEISQLPSMDEMRAQFVGLLQAPMSQTLGVMRSLLAAVPTCLDQKVKKEENT